jgi:hypothetical protein
LLSNKENVVQKSGGAEPLPKLSLDLSLTRPAVLVDLPGISANAGENGPRPVRRPRNPGMLAPKNGRAVLVNSQLRMLVLDLLQYFVTLVRKSAALDHLSMNWD